MKITETMKRWNQLAGTNSKNLLENRRELRRLASQDSYGNKFLNDILKEDLSDELEEEGDQEKEDSSEIGDDSKATLSNSELVKGLKSGAKDLADKIPNALNDEFAQILNAVKELAASGDKVKLQKLIKYIEKLG